MASLAPAPSLLKASPFTSKKTPTLLTRTVYRGVSSYMAPRRSIPFNSGGAFHGMRCVRVCKSARAIGSVDGEADGSEDDGFEDDDEEEEGIADDALRVTIRTSKKVLARQRGLLQKIAERRRRLVSSIQDTVNNPEQDGVTLDEKFSFLSNPDINSANEVSKTLPTEREEFSLPSEFSLGEALGLRREVNVATAQPKIMPPSLTEASESYGGEAATHGDTTELIAQIESMGSDAVHDVGKMDSPPSVAVDVMNIILVSAECAPWSKTGGLGDVAGALPKALARRGHRVMVVAPRYADYSEAQELGERRRYNINGQDMEVAYFHAFIDGVDFVFIDSPIFRHLGNDIYGGDRVEILKRMVLFCKAAVEVQWHVPCGGFSYGDGNLVFIANDWHTALLPVYLKAYYRDCGSMSFARCVLVIHNIAHQGRGPLDDFNRVDLPGHYIELFKLYDPLGGEHFNIFAAGLKTADRVVTVSHGYAWELKTPEGGWGLHGIINENDWKFQGIVNGIDTKEWSPTFDIHLQSDGYMNYSLETLHAGKSQCKAALQRELGLAVRDDVPILAFIGRLDHQKGVDLIAEAVHWIVSQDVQLIMLGSGRPDLEDMLRSLESQNFGKVRSWVGFSVQMAHRITAGADVLLMPSRFEPCGLNQLYAMMYGTVPVVHAVGGLRDTVTPFDPFNETGLGWSFDRAEVNRLIDALGHCLNTYRNYKSSWEGLQRRGMMQDLSWDNAAQRYEEVLLAAKYHW